MLRKLAIGAFAAAIIGVIGAAAGQFNGYPIVGGSSYCLTTINGVCSQTVPAGPSAITGAETIPADTNLSGGANPQTVVLSMASINALPVSVQTVVAGSAFYTYTVPNNIGTVIFDIAAGTISDERVTAPAAPVDGQTVAINCVKTCTAFQFIANSGQTLAATTPTALTASTTAPQGYKWVYNASAAKWYRLQ